MDLYTKETNKRVLSLAKKLLEKIADANTNPKDNMSFSFENNDLYHSVTIVYHKLEPNGEKSQDYCGYTVGVLKDEDIYKVCVTTEPYKSLNDDTTESHYIASTFLTESSELFGQELFPTAKTIYNTVISLTKRIKHDNCLRDSFHDREKTMKELVTIDGLVDNLC